MKKTFTLGGTEGGNKLTEQTESIKAENNFNLKMIKVEQLVPNKLNEDFKQVDIEALALSIEDIGLQHNLTVIKQEDGKYRLISGERRFRAIREILQKNPDNIFKNGIPCKVIDNITSVEEEIRLIRSNTDVRTLSPVDKRKAILRLIELYKIRKENGEINSIYTRLAEDLQMTVRQVQKYAATENLIPQMNTLLESGKITLNEAEKYSVLDEDAQMLVYDLYLKQGVASKEEFDEIKRLQEEKKQLKDVLTDKISRLAEERDGLIRQINEKKAESEKLSESMEHPNIDIETIVRGKIEADKNVDALMRQKEQLQSKYNELKEELKKPVKIDELKLKTIKAEIEVESAMQKLEDYFEVIRKKSSIILGNEDLKIKYEILANRMYNLFKTK